MPLFLEAFPRTASGIALFFPTQPNSQRPGFCIRKCSLLNTMGNDLRLGPGVEWCVRFPRKANKAHLEPRVHHVTLGMQGSVPFVKRISKINDSIDTIEGKKELALL